MCGIAGYISRSGPAETEILRRMLSAISHRGPDRYGGFIEDSTALGSARLSIVDLQGGHQPVVSEDRQLALVFNGEIFNYRHLRAELAAHGVRFRTNSEVETLVHLYRVHEEGMFTRLYGQFAIAVWDKRKRRIVLGRDRVGIRPLFWHHQQDGFAFASEVKALAQKPGIQIELDKQALVQTFRFWTVVGERTAFEGIRQVPPGHFLIYAKDKVKLERYWDRPSPNGSDTLNLPNEEAYVERFAEELDAAVTRQRMADVPIGCYLSGGIDSSVVAFLVQNQLREKSLPTYSVTFSDSEYDESAAQKIMTDRFGFRHASVHVHAREIGEVFPEVVWHAETPLFRTAPAPLFLLSRKVHQDGLKVVMTGEGADEVLLGYDIFRETAIRRFWARRPDSAWRGDLFRRLYHYLPHYQNPRFFELVKDFYRPTLTKDESPHYAMAVRWANGRALEVYFDRDLRDFASAYCPVAELERWLPVEYGQMDDIDRAQSVEMQTLLANYLLSSQGDRMSMAHSVEGRYPYLDDEFISFANRLPRSIKLRGLKDKFILRCAFKNHLPAEVLSRPKVAYQAPDLKSFFHEGEMLGYVEELLSPRRIRESGLFDAERVAQLTAKGRAFNLARVGNRDNMAFTLILSTLLLEELFIKKKQSFQYEPFDSFSLHMV